LLILNSNKIDSDDSDDAVVSAASKYSPKSLAVTCVDPSSLRTGGSILGDKTRMDLLSRHASAYVRPTPAQGHLGGLSCTTSDTIHLCQSAGYEFVIVETVGKEWLSFFLPFCRC
jgi:putative protein kinase ArgK-like GTPase of G3E family